MENTYKNLRESILSEISSNKALKKQSFDWENLQELCVYDQRPSTDNTQEGSATLVPSANKLTAEVTQEVHKQTIIDYISKESSLLIPRGFLNYLIISDKGVLNFGIDLFYGSVQQNLEALMRIREAALEKSRCLGFLVPLSLYLRLSPRQHFTGGLKRSRPRIKLRLGSRVRLTSDRTYASYGCHSTIYVNARFLIPDLEKCDIICIGKTIELRVLEVEEDRVLCAVITPGVLTPRLPVKFSSRCQWVQWSVSAEELEDITFAMGANVNVMVSYVPRTPAILQQMRDTLMEFKCDKFYLFTRLTLENVESFEDAKWISNGYDGFLIDNSEVTEKKTIVRLSPAFKKFMQKAHERRKPIILKESWSKYVHPTDYNYAFYYPDKYVLPCDSGFIHLFEALISQLSPPKCVEVDRSISGSSALARSIVAASFDFQADVIFICSTTGKMAMKIAQFRPIAPILAITDIRSVVNCTSLHHNILTLFCEKVYKQGQHKKDTFRKLIHGLRYAVVRELVSVNSNIILVFRKFSRLGFTDKFAVVRFDEDYVETIRKVIINKPVGV